jgi:zinc and cadmium transporter
MGIALGLSLHTLTDGLALAAHVQADLIHDPSAWLPGVGTFLGIVLHKPLDSLSITSLMKAGGWSPGWRNAVNLGYALLCPLGALLFCFGVSALSSWQSVVVGGALAFSAGVFVCIALSDLLPEVEFHSHDRVPLSAAFLIGLFLSWGIGFLEPEHSHGGHDHDHGHDREFVPPVIAPTHDHDH